ncbi:MAG: acyl-CoA dehydrogenase [Pseudomonadota bacterium]
MSYYQAPVRDIQFVIENIADLESLARLPGFEDADPETVASIVEEASKLAGDVLAPLNRIGDQQGATLEDGNVTASPGFGDAYRQIVEGGWNSLSFNPEYGGQGMPGLLAFVISEIWQSANMALSLCPMLTQAAVEALEAHGSDALKQQYLEKLVSGEWTGAMDLTEPQAGSDLAAVKTKAVPNGDHYLLSGQKIYITWGDHGMTDNIIHFVLARTPDAPAGVKGISLFLVPKYLLNDDGSIGKRNDMRPLSLEHKLGIHGSPTCVMGFGDEGGAVGYLVGEENNGLACMFTMMNHARLNVGIQGLGIAERAYQRAVRYAKERVQGMAPGVDGRATIVHHPDVRRMLMLMKSQIEAMRAMSYLAAAHLDHSHHATDDADKLKHRVRVDLLVPVVKGWCTEQCNEVASLAIQVHGGMGYVEETGAAQHYRDARIAAIYEGTSGIQAQDLAGRKVIRDQGRAIGALSDDMRDTVNALRDAGDGFGSMADTLADGVKTLDKAVATLLSSYEDDVHATNAMAFNLMMLTGTVTGGWLLAKEALTAKAKLADSDDEFYRTKIVTARFYAQQVMPRARAYAEALAAGSNDIMALAEDQF